MLYRHRFSIYWLGQTLSGFGDAFALVALPLMVLEATHSVAAMGLVSATGVAAQVVTSLISGAVVDRFDQRRLMLACDLGRACVYGLIPLIWWLRGPALPLLYLIVILGGVLSNVFSVAYMTAVPSLVGRERLNSANARLQGSLALSYVLGTLGAGYLTVAMGSLGALWLDAGTFLVSALSLFLIRFDPHPREAGISSASQKFGAGLRFLLGHPVLRAMTLILVLLGLSGNIGVGAGITDLMIYHVKHELLLDAHRVGICMACTAAGALLGAAIASQVARRWGSGKCFLIGNFVQASGLLLVGPFRNLTVACTSGVLWGAGMMMRGVPMHTLRQALVPRELLGRVTAISWTAIIGASAVGTALVTRVAAHASAATTLCGVGVAVGLIGVPALLSPTIRGASVTQPQVPTAREQGRECDANQA